MRHRQQHVPKGPNAGRIVRNVRRGLRLERTVALPINVVARHSRSVRGRARTPERMERVLILSLIPRLCLGAPAVALKQIVLAAKDAAVASKRRDNRRPNSRNLSNLNSSSREAAGVEEVDHREEDRPEVVEEAGGVEDFLSGALREVAAEVLAEEDVETAGVVSYWPSQTKRMRTAFCLRKKTRFVPFPTKKVERHAQTREP